MSTLSTIQLKTPYMIFFGDSADPTMAKTGMGIKQWRPELVAAQFRMPGCTADADVPDMTMEEAAKAGIKSIIIGVAPVGGAVPDHWMQHICEGAELGIDIVAGLHSKLNDDPTLVAAAEKGGARLVDVRNPPKKLPIGKGVKRTGMRLATVGTDCAVGKKYTSLALAAKMQDMGMKATFRATGQTGIMIAGSGIPIDSVVSDFVAGAAEILSPDNDADHWDIIEGQGGLFHPGYAAVTVGLLIGSQPDAIVICHEANRTEIAGFEPFPLPSIEEVIDRAIATAKLTNPNPRVVGIAVNTSKLSDDEREFYLADLSKKYDLPAVDPVAGSVRPIIDRLIKEFNL